MAFGRGRNDEFGMEEGPAPSTSSSAAGGLTAFIDQGSSFEGKLSFKDTVRIDGHFSGEITSENTLVVGETGEIEANIISQTVIVSGAIHGDVNAGRKVVIHKTGSVSGNVSTPSIVIEDGAVLNGTITMTGNKGGAAKANLKAVADVESTDSKTSDSEAKKTESDSSKKA
jgi:cytoskeletal protein CcmA (bactofilin family)